MELTTKFIKMKEILKEVADFINETYEGVRDADKSLEIIDRLNKIYEDESIEMTKKLCPHSILIEEKSTDEYGYCDQCGETIM